MISGVMSGCSGNYLFDIDRSNWDTLAGLTGLKSESTPPLWSRSKSNIESLREIIF